MSKGFLHDPINDINQLQQLLRDRYHLGFPIVKELIQNADDATARRMDFGWIDRLPGNPRHPLLHGPGLFVVNDGPFTADNAEAIRYLGLSNKPATDTATGKFGLGLKSIFHVCEAFFFLACQDEVEDAKADARNCPRTDVFNPYHAPEAGWHPTWDEFHDDDRALLRHALAPLLRDVERWFCLWIPVRRKADLNGASPIVERYPAAGSVFSGRHLHDQIAHVFPMLRNLEQVRAWGGNSLTERPVAEVSLTAGSTRRQLAPHGQPGMAPMRGIVAVTMGTSSAEIQYAGYEAVFAEPSLDLIKASDCWPRIGTIVPDTRRREQRKQAAHPHAAVVFSSRTGVASPRLSASWAVTLPVGDEPFTRVPADGDATVLTLHGHFFVDAGRLRVEFEDGRDLLERLADEQTVQRTWNRLLRDHGLSLLIPAMEQFRDMTGASDQTLSELTTAISQATYTDESTRRQVKLFTESRAHVCRDRQWVRRLVAEGTAWMAIPGEQAVFLLPEVPDNVELVQYFPGIMQLAHRHVLTTEGKVRLCRSEAAAEWTGEMVMAGLQDAPATLVSNERATHFLCRWLALVPESVRRSPLVACRLIELVRATMLRPGSLGRLRELEDSFRALLGLLPRERLVRLGAWTQDGRAEALLRILAAVPTSVLLVPSDLWPRTDNDLGTATLPRDDAVALLAALNALPAAGPNAPTAQMRSAAACDVIAATAGGVDAIKDRVADYCLFRVRDLSRGEGSWELRPLRELEQVEQCGLLFRDNSDHTGLARALQKAIKVGRVTLVDSGAADALYPGKVRPCTETACLDLLKREPALAAAAERADLLVALLSAHAADSRRIRYLLHARTGSLDGGQPLLRASGQELHGVWVKLLESALAVNGEAWRLVAPELAAHLSPNDERRFGVSTLSRVVVVEVLRGAGPEKVDCTALTATDARLLLAEFPGLTDGRPDDAAIQVLRGLRVHRTLDGNAISIGDGVYLESPNRGFDLDPQFAAKFALLRPDPDESIYSLQAKLCQCLTAATVVRLVMDETEPHQFWRLTLACLTRLNDDDLTETLKALRSTAWVPTEAGTAVAPEAIVYLGGLEEAVAPLLSDTCRGVRLDPAVCNAEGFAVFRERLLPQRREALATLGETLAASEAMHIGRLPARELNLDGFLACFSGAAKLMPAQPLLEAIRHSPRASQGDVDAIAVKLIGPLSVRRLEGVLRHLAARCEGTSDDHALRLFNDYLREGVEGGQFADVLPQIRLRNRRGQWRTPDLLCLDAPGIDDEFLLDVDQALLAWDVVASGAPARMEMRSDGDFHVATADFPRAAEQGAKELLVYLRQWQPLVPPTAIGGLLCTCGNLPTLRAAAEREYLGGASVDGVLDRLVARPLQLKTVITQAVPAKEVMAQRSLLFTFDDGATVREVNLLGGAVDTRVSAEIAHLIVGHPLEMARAGNIRQLKVRLRRIAPLGLSPQRRGEILRETAKQLLTRVGSQTYPDFDARWEELVKRDQLDVEVTQDLLLDHAPHYIRQLQTSELGELNELLNRQIDARYRLHEAERAVNRKSAVSEADSTIREIREQVRGKLLNDEAVQAQVVNALRGRVRAFQYEVSSIPFELFQNADDAVVEQQGLLGSGALPEEMRQIVVAHHDGCLCFMHWGRAINRPHGSDPQARARGYHRDLEKMLTLSQSDKEAEGQETTGKFGLGFKSVFLVCDRPKVLSRWLAFEVVAGLYPQNVSAGDLEHLQAMLRNEGSIEGTVIELPLLPDYAGRLDAVLGRFLRLVGLMLIFAKRVRRCRLRGIAEAGVADREIAWEPGALEGVEGVWTGVLPPADGLSGIGRVLVLGDMDKDLGTLLMPIGSAGPIDLPREVPTVWATAPTSHELRMGFAINAGFQLDPGRLQLAATSDANRVRALALGDAVGAALVSLFDRASDWTAFRTQLALAGDTTPEEFWWAVWDMLGRRLYAAREEKGPAIAVLRQVLWGSPQCGMFRLLANRPALPAGQLAAPYNQLSDPRKVKCAIRGYLAQPNVFAVVSSWESFRQAVNPGTVVAAAVADALEHLSDGLIRVRGELTLNEAVAFELGQIGEASPEGAARLGHLVTPAFLIELRSAQPGEHEELRERLASVRFQCADQAGSWAAAASTVISGAGGSVEEGLRAAFAPADRVLSSAYADEAIDFFKACRGQLRAGIDDLEQWALHADNSERRAAVFNYLIRGQFREELASRLRVQPSAWCNSVSAVEGLIVDVGEQFQIRGLLHLFEGAPTSPLPRRSVDPRKALARVYEWWQQEGPNFVACYEKDVYPGGQVPNLTTGEFWSDIERRQEWMKLFLLGVSHTMGRSQASQHRTFVELCDQKGWLSVFAAPDIDSERWMGVLDDYLEAAGDIPYYNWMRQFVGIYQVSRWLNVYGECFNQVDRVRQRFALDLFLKPRQGEGHFSGSELSAPPLTRALGMGASFVLRELVRLGHVGNPFAYEHCYVAPQRVRDLLMDWGCSDLASADRMPGWQLSPLIHRFLCQHMPEDQTDFGRCFDLPFLVLAEDEQLRARVLDGIEPTLGDHSNA